MQKENTMKSLYDELSEKIRQDPRLTKRVGPRQDIGLLLFADRDNLNELWKAADRIAGHGDKPEFAELRRAVERIRPLFGERLTGSR